MTTSTPSRPTPSPALIVFGTPTSPELTQASWFRAEDKQEAQAAAVGLKFSVIEIRTDAEKALTVGVHEGVLKGGGRMIVGSVTAEVYRRIAEYGRKLAGGDPAPQFASVGEPSAKSASEQNINTPAVAVAPASPTSPAAPAKTVLPLAANPWETLRPGARVLTAYWNEAKEFEGFWLATVKRVGAGEMTLEWFDAAEYPAFKTPTKNVAILHPEFRPTGK